MPTETRSKRYMRQWELVAVMTHEQLAAWRKRLKLSQANAAAALGASLTAFRGWEGGKHPVPGYIALACSAIERDTNPKMIIKQLRKMLADITSLIDSFEHGGE